MWQIWRDIKGFEGLYQVSNRGRVRSLSRDVQRKQGTVNVRGKVLNPRVNDGYYTVLLCKNGEQFEKYIHRLVAEAFIQNPNDLPQINHKDECKKNNYYGNLEYCTQRYNINYGTAPQRRKETREKNRRTENEIQSKQEQQQNKPADDNKASICRPLFSGCVLCRN